MPKTSNALKVVGDSMPINASKTAEYMRFLEALDVAFPVVDPGVEPLGGRVLVQMRTAKTVTDGGVILPDDSRDTEKDVEQVARVVALGPLAFRSKQTLEPWPECQTDAGFKPWVSVGDYVKVPRYGGDRHYMPIPGRDKERAVFAVFADHEMISKVTTNPLNIIAYV